ncbi:MAG TPA: DNA mismatch repair endonuclease MutL [Lachnospiraceae bacterium]|nr:DNA mismatch repair endonuclease MutL [Lachnospiraceae bacterium]
MNKIHLLDNNTINKIAAGEVVERPSSVVKELVENSIDAGASAITVEIRDGGTTLIKISDNGRGIEKEQVKTAFVRHATSKIEKIDDLDTVYSLGFRGEALASIASVSQVEMVTKTHEQEEGYKIEISGGNIIGEQEYAATDGTTINVKNIFYNVPARRKFLKKPTTESGYISDIVNKIALAHPEISIKYINNGNVMLHTSGNCDIKTSIFYVYGKEISQKMIDIDCTENGFRIYGLLGKPELSRGNRNYENLFINGRFVKNDTISQAVEDAYKARLMVGKFPVFVLNLSLSADMVDVNVHPAKLEVRFRDDDVIYDFVYNAVLEVLKNRVLIPEADWNSKPSVQVKQLMEGTPKPAYVPDKSVQQIINQDVIASKHEPVKYSESKPIESNIEDLQKLYKSRMMSDEINGGKNILKEKPLSYLPQEEVQQSIMPADSLANPPVKEEPKKESFFKNYKITGQIFSTYWIIEQDASIYLIDQHAAHERILFEEISNKFRSGKIVSQRLIHPLVVNLSEREKQLLKDNMELMQKFGFEIEDFGGVSYAVRSVPYIFKNPEQIGFFTEILDILDTGSVANVYDTKIYPIATIACKAAVKANDKLSIQEAISMVEKLLKLDNPFSCPHGRPTIIELTKYELEKKFKRIQ